MAERLANEMLDATQPAGRGLEAKGRHLPHGAGQQGLRPLPLVGGRCKPSLSASWASRLAHVRSKCARFAARPAPRAARFSRSASPSPLLVARARLSLPELNSFGSTYSVFAASDAPASTRGFFEPPSQRGRSPLSWSELSVARAAPLRASARALAISIQNPAWGAALASIDLTGDVARARDGADFVGLREVHDQEQKQRQDRRRSPPRSRPASSRPGRRPGARRRRRRRARRGRSGGDRLPAGRRRARRFRAAPQPRGETWP